MKKRARMLAGDLPRFPSLLITADGTSAQGAFAEAQVGEGEAGDGGLEGQRVMLQGSLLWVHARL